MEFYFQWGRLRLRLKVEERIAKSIVLVTSATLVYYQAPIGTTFIDVLKALAPVLLKT